MISCRHGRLWEGRYPEVTSVRNRRLAVLEELRENGINIQKRMLDAAQEAMNKGDEEEARAALLRKSEATKTVADLEQKLGTLRQLLVMLQVVCTSRTPYSKILTPEHMKHPHAQLK